MVPLTSISTTSAASADHSGSDSGIGGSEASQKTDEAPRQQPPGRSASGEGFEERSSLARSRLSTKDEGGLEPIKSRRKSTGSILACISALQCLFSASPDPNSGPPYVERLQPSDKHPHFLVQLKSDIEKETPKLSTVSAFIPAAGVPGEALVSAGPNETNEASETSSRLDERPRPLPRPHFNPLAHPSEPDQTRNSAVTSSYYSNKFFEVKRSGFSGLGAFALQDLKSGQRILTEQVLLKATELRLYDEYDKLTPAQKQAYNSLCSHCPEHATGLERIRNIYDTNSFNMGDGLCGVYLVAARFNHACPPAKNVTYSFKGARQDITLQMTKDVTAGTELTLTYATCKMMLYRNWGFVCSCGGCAPLSQEELASINTPPTW